jgi:phage shock protein PspC (stress-responsive transcriptional regulator)
MRAGVGCLFAPGQGHDRGMDETKKGKQLIRPREGRMVAGVCAGIGDYLGVDANIVRLVFAALTIFSIGAGALVYLVAWAVVPEEGEEKSIAENYMNKSKKS